MSHANNKFLVCGLYLGGLYVVRKFSASRPGTDFNITELLVHSMRLVGGAPGLVRRRVNFISSTFVSRRALSVGSAIFICNGGAHAKQSFFV